MLGGERYFARPPASLAAQPVDDAAMGNSDEPRAERSLRVVGMAYHVNRDQHVLHRIVDI